jgi:hypothetical protein
MIQGICGRTYIESFAGPEREGLDLLFLWENRLRERLATIGSTESALIWRRKDIRPGLSISRLAVSTRHTNGTDNIGRHWPTAQARDGMPPHSEAYIAEKKAQGHGMAKLNDTMALTDRWSTARASDGERGGQPLPAQMHQAHWVTASARDWKDSAGMATEAGDRSRLDQLPRQMAATWVTVQAMDGSKGNQPPRPHDTGISLPQHMAATWGTIRLQAYGNPERATHAKSRIEDQMYGATSLTGQTPNGSSATTEKPGAPNPVFAFWLMGFPDEWISGALEAMRSYRKPRKKSSRR